LNTINPLITKILILDDPENHQLTVFSYFEKGLDIMPGFDTFDECWDYVKLRAKEADLTMENIEIKFLRDIVYSHLKMDTDKLQ
jgi:hypothetical protein